MHYSSDSSERLYFIMTSSDGASTTMNVTRLSDGGKDAAKTSEIQQLVYEYMYTVVHISNLQRHLLLCTLRISAVVWQPSAKDITGPVSKVSFQVTAGGGDTGVVAIDDLRVFQGRCDASKITPTSIYFLRVNVCYVTSRVQFQ